MKHLKLTALLGLGLLCACSNEDDPANNNNQNGAATQAQIVISVSNNAATTRTVTGNTGDTNEGTEAEYKVSDLAVILTDRSNIIQAIHYPDVKAENDGQADATVATEVFPISAGSYKVYVLANYKAAGEAIGNALAAGVDLGQVFTINETAIAKLYGDNNFLMANTDLVAEVTDFTVAASGKEVDSDHSTVSDGQTVHLVNVNIERVVAKVTFTQTNGTAENKIDVTNENDNSATIGQAVLDGAAIMNLNRKMYLIREAKTATNKPSSVSGTWIYPEDPNYNTVLEKGVLDEGYVLEATWCHKNFINSYQPGITEENLPTFSPINDNLKFYCPENTMTANAQQHGQTTGVMYKATITLNADVYTELAATNGTSAYDQIFAAILALDNKDAAITTTTFTADGPDDGTFYTYNNLIFKNKNAAVLYQCIATATGTNATEKATAANAEFSKNKDNTGSLLDAIGVCEYAQGANYYYAWIKHNPTSTANMEQDKYGVVRNHWYDLSVTKITGLGYHKPTIEDPHDPADPAVANIQVAATIKPWTIVKQDVEL